MNIQILRENAAKRSCKVVPYCGTGENHALRHVPPFQNPPGTGKWNKIEHRVCTFISRNWQGMTVFIVNGTIP
ncbi:MAG: hypothetical protein LBJ24_03665 [Treponema sp.]|nr:hypothetical protein [Treponema sp.]